MKQAAECLVMAKPAGSRCNIHCDYCYYIGKKEIFRNRSDRMPYDLLERYISQRIAASRGSNVHFEWHGGEPTLLGPDYFRKIIELQRKYIPEGKTFSNGIQTNGLLIDEKWADFLGEEKFSVGLSLDGPEEFHNLFRKTPSGLGTHGRVIETFRLLRSRKVFCNVLCVLHYANAAEPDKLYNFFRDLGVSYLQFLPLTSSSDLAAPAETIGKFLCRIFDRWIIEDVGRMVIQTFDEALRPVYGIPHALCIHRETCGDVAVLEQDGSFYICDHFVNEEHLIGNINEKSLGELAADRRMIDFGKAKSDRLPRYCRECDVLSFCNGGCPKDRTETTPDGEEGLNYLCSAYRTFFTYAREDLTDLANHIKEGRSLRSFRASM